MRNEQRSANHISHRAEDQGSVSKFRAVIFVSAVLAYTIYTIEKNAILSPQHWLSLASKGINEFSCYNAGGRKMRFACNIGLSVVCLTVFLAALYACVKKYYRMRSPSAEEASDLAAGLNQRSFVQRISPKEYEEQAASYTRRQIQKLVSSPEYSELRRLKGSSVANWNWQADPYRNQDEQSEEEEEGPEKEDESPLPKKKGPYDIGASPSTLSSAKKKLF